MSGFNGFPTEAPAFLAELGANNEVGWFRLHKTTYDTAILAPMRALVAELAPAMLAIDPRFDVDPKGGAVSRIRRDVRFSRDKTPFRVNQWISFKHRTPDWSSRPAYFMEFAPLGYRCGMGFYAAQPAAMAHLRGVIAAHPDRLVAAMRPATAAGFTIEGECYRRPRLPADLPPEATAWMSRKSAYAVRNHRLEAPFFSAALADDLRTAFAALAPLYHLLAEASA